MLGNNLLSMTGKYDESASGMASCSKAGILASTIAWGAEHDIPFDQALATMTDYGFVRSTDDLIPHFDNFIKRDWNTSLELAIIDLKKGARLHQALRKRLSNFLPPYFLNAVEQAEKSGCLAEVMPKFAKRINFVTDIKLKVSSALTFPIIELILIIFITSGLSIFIVPKFDKIFYELTGGKGYSVFLKGYIATSRLFLSNFLEILAFIAISLTIFYPLKPYFKTIFEEIVVRIPFINRSVKRNALLELAGSMASYLASGKDIYEAAEISASATGRPWLKRRLRRFSESVRNGQNWAEAWRDMKLGVPLDDWIMANASARGNPAEGFDTMLAWISNDVSKSSVKKIRWIEISGIFLVGLVVAFIAIALLGTLFNLIGFLAEEF